MKTGGIRTVVAALLVVLVAIAIASVGIGAAGAGTASGDDQYGPPGDQYGGPTKGSAVLVYDSGPVTGDPYRDMLGPAAGSVDYNQRKAGRELRLRVGVEGGDTNTNYVVSLYCGPTHDSAGPLIYQAQISTKGDGRAFKIYVVPAESVAVCGPGAHSGHLDLDSAIPSTLAATPINFSG